MQTYENHTHRPVLSAVGLAFWLLAFAGAVAAIVGKPWGSIAAMTGLLGATLTLLATARLYATRLQDRIILLEMQMRGATLLSPAQQEQLAMLGTGKIVALRFASNEELPALLERAVRENLSADAIKRAIERWRPDHLRT